MLRRHFPLNLISRFCAEPPSISREERAELAHHLSTGCRRCWSAVSDVAPGSVQPGCDPLAEALYHVSTPQSRAVLMADHLAAVEDVRRRPFGFGFLLLEEALSFAWGRPPAPFEDDVFPILGTLRPGRQERQHHDDLYAVAMAYLSLAQTSRGELDAARQAWLMAERHRHDGTGNERVRATVLEAHASLGAALGDTQRAEIFLDAALVVLDKGRKNAWRRFELYGRMVDVVIAAGELDRLSALLEHIGLLLKAAASGDDLSRARAIYKRAVFVALLAARLEPHGWRLKSALRGAVAELEAGGDLFATATDTTTQTLRLLCLSRLYTFLDAERAAALYREAQSRLQPEDRRYLSVDVAELEQAFGHLRTEVAEN